MLLLQERRWPRFKPQFLISFRPPCWSLKSARTSHSTNDGACNCSRLLTRILRLASATLVTTESTRWLRTPARTRGDLDRFLQGVVPIPLLTVRQTRDSAKCLGLRHGQSPITTAWWFRFSTGLVAGVKGCFRLITLTAMHSMKYRMADWLRSRTGSGRPSQQIRKTRTTCAGRTDRRTTMCGIPSMEAMFGTFRSRPHCTGTGLIYY